MVEGNYSFEDYTDNWSNWQNQFPNIPLGVNGDVGFAIVNPDGTFDPNYPISPGPNSPAQPGSTGLAIGGWTNSQPGGGLYQILTQALGPGGTLTAAQRNLINTIIAAAEKNGYKNIVLDYENYGSPPPPKEIYTTFMEALGNALHAKGMTLEMAISPVPQNQQYYDLPALVNTGAVDHFQVMCYDYALGQGPPVKVEANSSIAQTQAFLSALEKRVPLSKLTIGVAFYGVSYQIPPGTPLNAVIAGLNGGTLTGQYTDPNSPTISDDALLKMIGGNWGAPSPPWQLIHSNASPPDYFYYNQNTGQMISAFPPASIHDFASMVKQNFPEVAGFFAWDADDDFQGKMMQVLVDSFAASSPPSVQTCITEIQQWLASLQGVSPSWVASMEDHLKNSPPATIEDLTSWLNSVFHPSSGKYDLYMTSGLLLSNPGFNPINQLDLLFSQNPNLLTLKLDIPTPTFADMVLAKAQGWVPHSVGGMVLLNFLFQTLQNEGSGLAKDKMQELVNTFLPRVSGEVSSEDRATFSSITGVWI